MKRKLSDVSHSVTERKDMASTSTKKPRLSTSGDREDAAAANGGEGQSSKLIDSGDKNFPNGYFYCHQCNRKRDLSKGLQCTNKIGAPKATITRCKVRYCEACLKNRYLLSMSTIKTDSKNILTKQEKENHVGEEDFYFKCPKCQHDCNCWRCRGKPSGENASIPPKPAQKPKQEASLVEGSAGVKKPKVVKKAAAATKDATKPVASRSAKNLSNAKAIPKTKAAPKPKAKPAPPPKPEPKPTWSSVPTSLSQSSAESRIQIREFLLRFSSTLDMTKSHLDELEEIAGAPGHAGAVAADGNDEGEEFDPWVSETCVKAITLGLLSVVADDSDHQALIKIIRDTIKEIRSCGGNLHRIWTALASLRTCLWSVPINPFNFPDPLPPPSNYSFRTTRSGYTQADDGLYVGTSAQLVPVIASLVESAVQTKAIKDDLERGANQEKNAAKEVREAIAKENAKWKDRKASGSKSKANEKAQREQHKEALQDLEFAHRVVQSGCIPRYAPLGQDHDGRMYYALAPSEAERGAATQLIAGKDGKVKLGRRRAITPEERKSMRRWSWFVAVWGRVPEGAVKARDEDDDEDEADDADAERWWGFWEPEQIKMVADWIAYKCELGDTSSKRASHSASPLLSDMKGKGRAGSLGSSVVAASTLSTSREPSPLSDLSDEEDADMEDADDSFDGTRTGSRPRSVPNKTQLFHLVQGLRDHADLLQWRIRRVGGGDAEEYTDGNIVGAVPAQRFY
ncbi:hypothetical protein WOLCODRAFT_138306 [Wolfiporia cocos MD-104 SS10]|uniref:Zinc-finger domain-containing protein n=1 Tax=Wolfiporia cocos (strain MD-104) TaxID=742152 RepID=A0A2H3JTU2_WOLCO|nr:hypothetical protein WOLCODRAFT_138306 [Wolfiporia cocos MD-104 SS10]